MLMLEDDSLLYEILSMSFLISQEKSVGYGYGSDWDSELFVFYFMEEFESLKVEVDILCIEMKFF